MGIPTTCMMPVFRGKISHGATPPGGWKFQQGSITINAPNWYDLVKNVRAHRVNNKMPLGEIESEIENQILILHPHLRLTN